MVLKQNYSISQDDYADLVVIRNSTFMISVHA